VYEPDGRPSGLVSLSRSGPCSLRGLDVDIWNHQGHSWGSSLGHVVHQAVSAHVSSCCPFCPAVLHAVCRPLQSLPHVRMHSR
jgi:hypothetical protein